MACYAAVLSVMQTIHHINIHPRPPISLDQQQLHSLTQNLTFLKDFLERCYIEGDDDLESRIVAAAYAAEDVIETHIVDQIHAGSTSVHAENISSVDLYGGLETVIKSMDLIKRDVMQIIQQKNMGAQDYDQHKNSSVSTVSGEPASTRQSSITPVFDDVAVNEVLDKLTGQQSSLQIISFVGMGGIGKTTFARNIYEKPLIVQHFDIKAWVTISQEYSVLDILRQVLFQDNIESVMSENELGERVHKKLWNRRYLIVMDDIWSTEALYRVRCFFPDNNNGSRMMITTRLTNLALEVSGSHVFQMKFLDEDKSWGLLCETVFGKELGCPVEFDNIGKKIARYCRGLPLSIVVIGGLLKKTNRTRAHWENILQNLNLLINLEDGEYWLQILSTSYKELPIHVKPCFLYLGVFREDHKIRVRKLTELWVAEGILRPTKGKKLEEVAIEYVNELIDRNLIIVDKLSWNGRAKFCKIHDLLRDLCLREAWKQRFFCVLKYQRGIPPCMNMERRVCIHDNTKENYSTTLESASSTRSLIATIEFPELVQSRLLRVYSGDYNHCVVDSVDAIFQKANLRFLTIALRFPNVSRLCFSRFLFWNLQTLKVDNPISWESIKAPYEIWEMPLLRHVMFARVELPDPLCGESIFILEHLQTLACVSNFKFTGAVIKRIPNIKTLKLYYKMSCGEEESYIFGLNSIGHLTKLQTLNLSVDRTNILDGETFRSYLMENLSFPHSLEKLTLSGTGLNWEDCTTKIGSLPLLQFLKLGEDACFGPEWETVEGQFCSLKFLQIEHCDKLRYWMTEDTHFPRLEHLVLRNFPLLEEIPSSIGDIPTLKSIVLDGCSTSAEVSAKGIKEETLELGDIDLLLHITDSASFNNLHSYLTEVQETFQYKREKIGRFIDSFDDLGAERIDYDSFTSQMKEFFKDHPNLMHGLNKIIHTDEEEAA